MKNYELVIELLEERKLKYLNSLGKLDNDKDEYYEYLLAYGKVIQDLKVQLAYENLKNKVKSNE